MFKAPTAVYVDGTFGAGGYSATMLAAARCRVLGIDRDPAAIRRGAALAAQHPGRLTLIEGRFGDMARLVGEPATGAAPPTGRSPPDPAGRPPDAPPSPFTLDLTPRDLMRLMNCMISKQMRAEVGHLDQLKRTLEQ